jgi:hypothetical protein
LGFDDDDLAAVVFAALDWLAFQQVVFGTADQTARGVAAIRSMLAARRSGEAN